jgi:ubiquinol-cytochrome c reductase cytochrome c1 subunit
MLRQSGRRLIQSLGQAGSSWQALPAGSVGLSSSSSQHSGQSEAWYGYGVAFGLVGVGAVSASTVAFASGEAEHGMHTAHFPWSHEGPFSSYDHASIRRGHQVYQQVCAACHSLERIHYRQLIGVCYTEEEAKQLAEDAEIEDGPNEEGEMFTRPGKLSDAFPSPYKNEAAGRFVNGGAYPPDLSLMTKARHNGQNYLFSLLLGYREPPAGVRVREGLHYNPYFPGGAIAMPKMLVNEGTDYEDGTPASESQQAKDVTTFLSWCAEPEHDDRKLMGIKWTALMVVLWLLAVYYKRWIWSPIKSRRVVVDVVN